MTEEELRDRRWALQYRSDYSARYHRRRSAFLSNTSLILSFATALAGASSFASLMSGSNLTLLKWLAAITTAIGFVQLVFRISAAGMTHAQWLKRWNKLNEQVNVADLPTKEQVHAWEAERTAIESDCVGEFRALIHDCENRTITALSASVSLCHIGRVQRLFIHFGTFQQDFPTVDEHRAKQAKANVVRRLGLALAAVIIVTAGFGYWCYAGPAQCRLINGQPGYLRCTGH